MPDEAPQAGPPAPVVTGVHPSKAAAVAPAPSPPWVQAIDHLGEIGAVLVAGFLCYHGKLSGEAWMGFSAIVLGVQTGIRGFTKGRAVGAAGLAFLALGGSAIVRVLPLAALALVFAGCPKLPPPDGCTPRDMTCRSGRPFVCSPSQRWTPGDRACGELPGATCCRALSPYGRVVSACVMPADCLPDPPPPSPDAAIDGGALAPDGGHDGA